MRNFLASVAITYYFNAISLVQSFSVEAPAPAPKDIAIVGCGVLGTSLLRQLVTSPEFESKSSEWSSDDKNLWFTAIWSSVRTTEPFCFYHEKYHQHNITVTAITKTSNNHESILISVGSSSESSSFDLTTMDEIPKDQKFSNVVFCAPPSAFDDYPAAVADASDDLWFMVRN